MGDCLIWQWEYTDWTWERPRHLMAGFTWVRKSPPPVTGVKNVGNFSALYVKWLAHQAAVWHCGEIDWPTALGSPWSAQGSDPSCQRQSYHRAVTLQNTTCSFLGTVDIVRLIELLGIGSVLMWARRKTHDYLVSSWVYYCDSKHGSVDSFPRFGRRPNWGCSSRVPLRLLDAIPRIRIVYFRPAETCWA